MCPRFTKRQWFIIKWTYPPIGWGVGAMLVAWLDILEMDLLSAFILGCIVGLVHDIALVAFGVGKWGDRYSDELEKSESS
jgi:hypothetical protein